MPVDGGAVVTFLCPFFRPSFLPSCPPLRELWSRPASGRATKPMEDGGFTLVKKGARVGGKQRGRTGSTAGKQSDGGGFRYQGVPESAAAASPTATLAAMQQKLDAAVAQLEGSGLWRGVRAALQATPRVSSIVCLGLGSVGSSPSARYQLALALSKGTANPQRMDDDEGRLIQAAKDLSLKTYNGDKDAAVALGSDANASQTDSDVAAVIAHQRAQEQSEHDSEQLARQLQELEYARQRPAANPRRRPARPPPPKSESTASSCTVS